MCRQRGGNGFKPKMTRIRFAVLEGDGGLRRYRG